MDTPQRTGPHTPVTPTLFLGTPPPFPDAEMVSSAEEAVRVVRAGKVAVLPEGAYDEAQQALEVLSGSREYSTQRVASVRGLQ